MQVRHGSAGPLALRRAGRKMPRVALLVVAVGLAVTAAVTVATWVAYDGNEDRLLEQRTEEATEALEASLLSIEPPLAAAAELAEVTGGADADSFARAIGTLEPQPSFVSASIWPVGGDAVRPLVEVGRPLALTERPAAEIQRFLRYSASFPGLAVMPLLDRPEPRVGYSFTSTRTPARFIVYAESALPADRTSVVQPDDAFAGLSYAIYLGDAEVDDRLLLAGTADLPLQGRRATASIPLGDTQLLLVMTAEHHLGGGLLAALPWLVSAGGTALSLAAAVLTGRLLRRRDEAELLARENRALYQEQHDVAHALQHSLLPQSLPTVPDAELAVRYRPGVSGMEIGGDWYDAMPVGASRLCLTVGDVSGRGLRAAGVMATLRHAARAFASVDPDPGAILSRLNRLPDPDRGATFATVVCVLVDLDRRTAFVATAGHPPPLLLDGDGGRLLETAAGPPVGVVPDAAYPVVEVALPPAGTLLLFTDGLYERRDEVVDRGLERLRAAAAGACGSLDALLDSVLEALTPEGAADDVAILGLRWPAAHLGEAVRTPADRPRREGGDAAAAERRSPLSAP